MSWGYPNFEARCPGHIFYLYPFSSHPTPVRVLWLGSVWAVEFDRCWSSGLQKGSMWKGLLKWQEITEQQYSVWCSTKSSPWELKLCTKPKQRWSVRSGHRLPLVITLLGYETPNALLVWKWDFISEKKKKKAKGKKKKKERKEKSGKQSVPGAFPGH